MITDKQIRKILALTSFPIYGSKPKRLIHREGMGMDLGPEADMIAEVRKILGDEKGEFSRRVSYHLNLAESNVLELRRYLVKEGAISESIQTPQEELVDMPVVRAVQDKRKGSTVQGEENPS